jgi:hypothetical protein
VPGAASTAEPEELQAAKSRNITLVPFPFEPKETHLTAAHAKVAVDILTEKGISYDPQTTIWLGHDFITGGAALKAAKLQGGRSALIHHMSYEHYEAFAENAATANEKTDKQEALFSEADILMAVGPVLRDALEDLVDGDVNMIVPGLAEIEPKKKPPNTFSLFISGRLIQNASKVKQGQLAVAAFAKCYKEATKQEQPEALLKRPKLLMRGVKFNSTEADDTHFSSSEENLQKFAESYADAVINLHPLPYTTDRQRLFKDLKSASVAAMPSWHEGFGLVAWEAIAAGVPLILSKNSGVYELIEEKFSGFEQSHVWTVDIKGKVDGPYFSDTDLNKVSDAINKIARDPIKAREKALRLRDELMVYTWSRCAEEAANVFEWDLTKGMIEAPKAEDIATAAEIEKPAEKDNVIDGFSMPERTYDAKKGSAVSVLLRSSEAVVPFDCLRQPELDKLLKWSQETEYPITLRLIKGEGGLGKTRLATELCHELKKQDWTVGFLAKDQKQPELATIWRQLQETTQPCLIVVDYAETQTTELLSLLKLMLKTGSKTKVCLLLLARDGGEWWDNLPAKDAETEGLLGGYATSGPYLVSPLYDSLEQRQEGYQIALASFAKFLGIAAPESAPDLSGDHFVKPLYIQMTALLTLHGEQPTSADGITKGILHHEQRY